MIGGDPAGAELGAWLDRAAAETCAWDRSYAGFDDRVAGRRCTAPVDFVAYGRYVRDELEPICLCTRHFQAWLKSPASTEGQWRTMQEYQKVRVDFSIAVPEEPKP